MCNLLLTFTNRTAIGIIRAVVLHRVYLIVLGERSPFFTQLLGFLFHSASAELFFFRFHLTDSIFKASLLFINRVFPLHLRFAEILRGLASALVFDCSMTAISYTLCVITHQSYGLNKKFDKSKLVEFFGADEGICAFSSAPRFDVINVVLCRKVFPFPKSVRQSVLLPQNGSHPQIPSYIRLIPKNKNTIGVFLFFGADEGI